MSMLNFVRRAAYVLDKYSFVFINDESLHSFYHYKDPVINMKIGCINGSKAIATWDNWSEGVQERSRERLMEMYDDDLDPEFRASTEIVMTDRHGKGLESVEFPALTSLFLNFNNNKTRPVISNLSLPNLRRFKIHYSGKLPIMRDIGLGKFVKKFSSNRRYQSRWPNMDREKHKCFELCNIDGFNYEEHPVVGDPIDEMREGTPTVSLKFTRHFHRISLIGTPDFVLSNLHLNQCRALQVYRTVDYSGGTSNTQPVSIKAQHLCMFSWKTSIKSSSTPNIDTRGPNTERTTLERVAIYTSAPGVRLGDIFSRPSSASEHPIKVYCNVNTLKSVSIVCDLPKRLVGRSEGHITLKRADLEAIVLNIIRIENLNIHGYFIGDQNLSLYDDPLSPDIDFAPGAVSRLLTISLGLVRHQKDVSDTVRVNTFSNVPNVSKVIKFHVYQITGGTSYKRWRHLTIKLPRGHYASQPARRLKVSRDFEHVTFNGENLHVPCTWETPDPRKSRRRQWPYTDHVWMIEGDERDVMRYTDYYSTPVKRSKSKIPKQSGT